MDTPVLAIAVTSIIVGVAAYLAHHLRGRKRSQFDGGVVSQSWLIEHRASTQDDRYS
jgi:hypothetical protein